MRLVIVRLGRKVFLPLSLARVVPVSGLLVTFQWLPLIICEELPSLLMGSGLVPKNAR